MYVCLLCTAGNHVKRRQIANFFFFFVVVRIIRSFFSRPPVDPAQGGITYFAHRVAVRRFRPVLTGGGGGAHETCAHPPENKIKFFFSITI